MKNAPYFSHDFNARNDPKLLRLQMKLGMEGVGIFWCIVEMLHEQGGFIPSSECERIAFELRTQYETIQTVLNDYQLFENDGEKYWSPSAIDRIKLRSEKSDKARISAELRWKNRQKNDENGNSDANALRTNSDRNANALRTNSDRNANALRSLYDGNAIKEKKGKEIKEKEIERKVGKGGLGEKPDSPLPDADAPGTFPSSSFDSKISISKTPKPKPIPLPSDFSISDRVLDWSRREGYTHLPQYLEVLLNWVQNRKNEGKEPKYLDWDLVLMRCIREDWGKVKDKAAAQPVTRRYLSDTSADWAAVYQSEVKNDNT